MTYIRVLVDEDLPEGAYQIAPNVRVVGDSDLLDAVKTPARTVYCFSRMAAAELTARVLEDPTLELLR